MKLGRSSRALCRAPALAAAMTAGLLAFASDAQAQVRVGFRGELGAGTMIAEWQRNQLRFDSVNFEGTGRLYVAPVDFLSFQVSVSNWLFLNATPGADLGHVLGVMGGFRLEPMLGRVGRLFLDANAGVGFTGPLMRFHFDAGLGFEFQAHRNFSIGPMVRYGHVVQPDDDPAPADAMFFAGGLSFSVGTARAESAPPPADTDSDGVIDSEDQCVSEPQGANPDPNRRGCPDGDQDSDGVRNSADQCRDVPAGDHPDPARAGCPLADADSDGVMDSDDQCVNEPQGANPDPNRRGCPDGDQDSDGVRNSADQCRDVPAGPHPDPARAGCPTADRDNDSVPDPVDHCPDQPGAPHPDPNRNGCPGQVRVSNGMIQINTPVFFGHNRDAILPRSFPILQAVADALRASPDIRRVSIEGHTDDVGADSENMTLSNRRAQSVMRWLTAHQVEESRLEAHGFGETRPLRPVQGISNRRERRAAQADNRRVEFRIVDPAPAAAATTTAAPK
jgi:outer membrane protein OmpA-like peptidoglycan-associated protein